MADQNDVSYRPPTWVSQGVSILNGMFGDYLHHRGNGLAIRMDCYHLDQPLALDRESLKAAYPEASRKLCVLIHGLGCNEGIWTFADAAAQSGADQYEAGTSYGTLLQSEAGYTPIFVRYNTGLAIADNARDLAALMSELLAGYPEPIDEVVFIGHSMGGLVIRGACHYGLERADAWVKKVKRVFYLGTPHNGADLEKFAHLTVGMLHAVDNPITQVIGNMLNLRSQGVKDLRHGSPLHLEGDKENDKENDKGNANGGAPGDEWQVPWLASARHYLIVGTLTDDPEHPASQLFGDALVRVPRGKAASDEEKCRNGAAPSRENIKVFAGVHHLGLAHEPRVYEQIKRWCN